MLIGLTAQAAESAPAAQASVYTIVLPGTIIAVAFLLKLLIDRAATAPDLISAMLELPVDIGFLATSLVAGYTMSAPSQAALGTTLFTCYIAGAIVVVFLWRRSYRVFTGPHYWRSLPIAMLNYAICIVGLLNAVQLIAGKP